MDTFAALIDWLNGILWGWLLIYVLIGAGIWFTLRSGLVQVRHFGHMFGVMAQSFRTEHGGISSFGAYCTSLAARVGTGNIAGVAVAIQLGGPGAVFWMWVTAIVGMATAFAEASLAQLFKIQDEDGTYRGGPAYYMERGLGRRWMGILFSIALIFAFGFAFNAVQTNSIGGAMAQAFGITRWLTGVVVVAITAFIIFGGIRRIVTFAEIVVPLMAVGYLLVALWVVFTNLDRVPGVLALVVENAFGFGEAAAGVVGYGVAQAMINGIKRGLFSNEAGMGSAPNAAATADIPHPVQQGYVQMLGVLTDTLVICSCTAFIVLLAGTSFDPGLDGVALTQAALVAEVGAWGAPFIAIALLFFAFTSIVANYYYGETSLLYIFQSHAALLPYRLLVLVMVMTGAVAETPLVWAAADVAMGLMALINLTAIILLSGLVVKILRDYEEQRHHGVEPRFDKSRYPELAGKLADGVW
jgi:AGCS family alanine or glycine:cation symporter